MNRRITTVFLFVLMFSLSACASTWHSMNKFYDTYIDPPVKYKMDDAVALNNPEEILYSSLLKVGEELTAFEQALSVLELPPSSSALDPFFLEFPWINGIALINPNGTVTGSMPSTYPSYIDFTSLLNYAEGNDKRDIRVILQNSFDRHTMLVGEPVFNPNGELVGIFIVYFDIEAFFEYMNLSPYVFVMAQNTPVWFGAHDINQTPLANVDFIDKVKSKSSGNVSNSFGKAEWINMYFYDFPIIFAVMQEK